MRVSWLRNTTLLVFMLALLIAPSRAAGYCVNPAFTLLWGELPEPDAIPVYVSIGPNTSVQNTGLSIDEVVRLTHEMIARHNEAGIGPTLEFRGLTRTDIDYGSDAMADLEFGDAGGPPSANEQFQARPFGITVDSFTCEWQHTFAPCGDSPSFRACAKSARTHPKARVSLIPIGCEGVFPPPAPHTLDANDLGTVMLHELGHALGLEHNQGTKETCEAGLGQVHGNAIDGNEGVMHAKIGGNFPALREWRRDDLDGLAALYGPPPEAELVAWDDAAFPSPPSADDLIALIGGDARRPPAISVASMAGADERYIATTDADDRVVVHAWSSLGLAPAEVVDPSASGRSWGNPGLALGESSVFVAWSAHELPDSSRVSLRWATRALDEDAWTIAEVEAEPKSRVKRLAAGYAPILDLFMITSLTDYESRPRLLLIDDEAQLVAYHELDAPPAFDIGAPACFADHGVARCVIPYSSNRFDGPKLGWLDLEFDSLGEPWLLDTTLGEVDATGKLGIAVRPDDPALRGAAGAQRYALAQLEGVGAEDVASPMPPPQFDGQGWPLAVGSSAPNDAPPRWWALARHRVVCGDGLRQASEQCDDGNLEPGDGCGDACLIEHEFAGDLDPGVATGDSGDAFGADDGEDCDCRSTPRSPALAALLLVFLALSRRRAKSV